jgi:hypothetical protein
MPFHSGAQRRFIHANKLSKGTHNISGTKGLIEGAKVPDRVHSKGGTLFKPFTMKAVTHKQKAPKVKAYGKIKVK